MEEKQTGRLIGIDLGTTNSCVAVWENGKAVIVPNSEGAHTTPSVAAFCNGEWVIGSAAARQAAANPECTVFSVKRDLGSARKIRIAYKDYAPQEILALILRKLRLDAEAWLGEAVTQAVVTVPSCFSYLQRRAVRDAGRIAGLEVLRLINGPSAAALAYGLHKSEDEIIVVYDLGGGMFSVTVFESGDGVFQVLATAGSNHIGGDDFDQRLTDYLAEDFKRNTGIDLRQDKMAMRRLGEAAEKAKVELSNATQTAVSLQYIAMDESGPKHLEATMTRDTFDKLMADLVKETVALTKKCLADAGHSAEQVGKVILVGGASRIPMVRETLKKTFGKEPFRGLHADECFAAGAAIEGGVLTGEARRLLLLDVLPITIGIQTADDEFTKLVERNTVLPTIAKKAFSTVSDNQTDMVVHILQGEYQEAHLNDEIGCFYLTGIAPTRRGVPQIEMKLEIGVRDDIRVSAKDLGSGKELQMTGTAVNRTGKTDAAPITATTEGQKDGAGRRFGRKKPKADDEKRK